MNWSASQQQLLVAMGYQLYRPARAEMPAQVVRDEPAATAPMPPAIATEDRLLSALRRAAGNRDLASVTLPPLSTLRSDPAAKRALWPLLRSLRRH